MSRSQRLSLAPEVVELIEEVAKHPDSLLLRRPRREVFADYFSEDYVRPTATGLSSAEAQLVEVYREDVARLLLEYAKALHLEGAGFRAVLGWKLLRDMGGPGRGSAQSYPARLRAIRSVAGDDLLVARALDDLLASTSANPTHLVRIAMRLVPSIESRFVAAGDLLFWRGLDGLACRAFLRIASSTANSVYRSSALANAGLAAHRLGHSEVRRDCYVDSYKAREGADHSILSAILASAELADLPSFSQALAEYRQSDMDAAEIEPRTSQLRGPGRLTAPSIKARTFARTQASRLSGPISELLDAFAS